MNQTTGNRLICHCMNQMVMHLEGVFQIVPGKELAPILAPHITSGSNERALRIWLRGQLADIASHPIDEVLLVVLEKRLLKTLEKACPDLVKTIEVPSPAALRSSLPLPYWQQTTRCEPRIQTRSWPSTQTIPRNNTPIATHKEDTP